MDYIKRQDRKIRKISNKHQRWYRAGSNVWGERYMREKQGILTQKRNEREARIILKHLPKNCRKILDAPCGYGRIANIFASRGYNVTGIDINKYFINIAKKQAVQKDLKVLYFIGDIQKKKLPGKFDAVLNIFTSIGYLENEEKNELFIKRLCQYVRPGGRLIIETINPATLPANHKSVDTIILKDGTVLHFKRFFDVRTSTSVTKIQEIEKDGNSKNLVHIIRLYYPHELINICEKFGCRPVSILDQNGNKKDVNNSLRIWIIFKKKR